jgi:DNA (cytosine-5)-methyltransferase 1
MLTMGSLFSGIGGLDLGLERAFKGQLQTAWQVEKESFCRSVLERHWSNAKRYDDVRTVGAHNLEPVDILCGGFPCQDISIAGKGEGINGKRSGLWWEFHRIINELRPSVVVMENVPAITIRGLSAVVGSLAQIGYDCQWTIISAKQCGAPHLRRRWFAVAYPTTIGYYMRNEMAFGTMPNNRWSTANTNQVRSRTSDTVQSRRSSTDVHDTEGSTADTNSTRTQVQAKGEQSSKQMSGSKSKKYWERFPTQSPVCRRDDGIPNRVDRLKSLGNAVVPQCAEWVGQQIIKSNILGERYVRN